MTYTGAMVLPQNAVVMQEEEMRYLEAGYYFDWSRSAVQKGADIAILLASSGFSASVRFGKLVAKLGKKKILSRIIKVGTKLGIKKAHIGIAYSLFSIVSDFTPGGAVAYLLDRVDKTGLNKRVQF